MRKILSFALTLSLVLNSFAQKHSLDLAFGTNGIALNRVGSYTELQQEGRQILEQSDGKLLIVFSSFGATVVGRYHPNNLIDSSYGFDGFAPALPSVQVSRVIRQKDDKLLLTGTYNGDFVLIRLLTTGFLDKSFGDSGIVKTDLGSTEQLTFSVLQPDDKIVAIGYTSVNGINQFAAVRYTKEGQLDDSFASGGIIKIDFGNYQYQAFAAVVQADGKIVIAGSIVMEGTHFFAIGRLTSNGVNDAQFGTDGITLIQTDASAGSSSNAASLAMQADGKIVVGYNTFLYRFTDRGELDTSFADGGMRPSSTFLSNGNENVSIQPDGKILVSYITNYWTNINRYWPDGTPDSSYGYNSMTSIIINRSVYGYSSILLKNGNLAVAGLYLPAGSATAYFYEQITPDGKGSAGRVKGSFNSEDANTYFKTHSTTYDAIDRNSEGAFITSGRNLPLSGDRKLVVSKHLSNGTLDASFGINGNIMLLSNSPFLPSFLSVWGTKIVVGQGTTLYMLQANGSTDLSFGMEGKLNINFKIVNISFQANGKIIVYGINGFEQLVLARYQASGELDNSFGVNGVVETNMTPTTGDLAKMPLAVQADDKIVVVGLENAKYSIRRFNANGSLDNNFKNGTTELDFGGYQYSVTDITLQEDGKIVGCGSVFDNGQYNFAAARLEATGTLDKGFGFEGVQAIDFGTDATAYGVTMLANGKIALAGQKIRKTTLADNTDIATAVLTKEGLPDPSFGEEGKDELDIQFSNEYAFDIASNGDRFVTAGNTTAKLTQIALLTAFVGSEEQQANSIQSDIVSEVRSDGSLGIYPNPSTSIFNLQLPSSYQAATIRITDISGRQLMVLKQANSNLIKFGEQLGKGTYFAEIIANNKKSVIKFIKQ